MLNPLGLLGFGFGHAKISKKRKLVALLIAAGADFLQWVLLPMVIEGALSPLDWAVDLATAAALLLVVGFKARLALAFTAELIPGLDMFPTWVALVLTLPTDDEERSVSESDGAKGTVEYLPPADVRPADKAP